MQGQNNTSDSLSTPISQQEQDTSNDTFHTSGIDPRTLKETKETQHTTETSIVGAKEPTDSRNRTAEESDDQQTLLTLLSTNQRHLDPEEDWSVISLHGPRHRGPRVSITIHQEACRTH